MNRATGLLSCGLLIALAACGWLYADNRSLRQALANHQATAAAAAPDKAMETGARDDAATPDRSAEAKPAAPSSPWQFSRDTERPKLSEGEPQESRAERRKRRQSEITAMFGRLDGESEEEYRARMIPFIKMTLAVPRERLEEARKTAEQAANVTSEQRQKLDQAFNDTYNEVVELTNAALASRDVTPYERNVPGLLGYAGGMGAILQSAESRVAGILTPEQVQTIYDQGFEWGEYLGVTAPWEKLNPPPPPDI